VQSSLVKVQQFSGGVNSVIPNCGLGIAVLAAECAIRMSSLAWRVDITPDVAAGVASGPVIYRVVAFVATQFPTDITPWQLQAFPAGSHPEIPFNNGPGAPSRILSDNWLDFSNGDPGLSVLAGDDWHDGGPTVDKGDTLCIVLTPIIDANLAQVLLSDSNAQLYLEAYGTESVKYSPSNGAGMLDASGNLNAASIPRYDVAIPRRL
jgi:hypothetical protein